MGFIAKHLPDPFHLEGAQRVSLREKIFREVVANLLVHREYTNAAPARVIIYADRVEIENANKPSHYGPLDPARFVPFTKNPTIAKFFRELGRADELGSGIRNVTYYLASYRPGAEARFTEEDVFRTIIPVPTFDSPTAVVRQPSLLEAAIQPFMARLNALKVSKKTGQRLGQVFGAFLLGDPLSVSAVADTFDLPIRTVTRDFALLREADLIVPATYGYYRLAE